MPYNNNIYGNAAFVGAFAGMQHGRAIISAVSADYDDLRQKAVAIAEDIDALIAFDAEVTTAADITQLAITDNIIASDEQWKAGLLQALTYAYFAGRIPPTVAAAGAMSVAAAAIHASWVEALTGLVTP